MVEDRILTLAQVAELLQVNYETARNWIRHGRIPGRKIGRVWRVVESELKRFITEARTAEADRDGT